MLGRGLARYIPGGLRPRIIRIVDRISERIADRIARPPRWIKPRLLPQRFRGDRVAVAGFFRLPTGLGRSASLLAHTLRNHGHEVVCVDLTASLGLKGAVPRTDVLEPRDLARMHLTDVVVHANPPLFLRALAALPARPLEECTMVGVWFWELERLPVSWSTSARYCDELWGMSPFMVNALRSSVGPMADRVRLVDYDVNADPFPRTTEEHRATARSALALAPSDFVVGYSFAVSSNFARKNPTAAVLAFRRAFGDCAHARLVLRCNDLSSYPWAASKLKRLIGGDSRIVVRGGPDHPLTLADFYAALDVYLALFRSEGYGLNLMEAAQTGLPVLATRWGLAPELLALSEMTTVGYNLIPVVDPEGKYDGIAGAEWAEPDIEDAAHQLDNLMKSRCRTG